MAVRLVTANNADLKEAVAQGWPGNIRELKNVIERTMILATQGDIDAAELPEEVRDHARGGSKDRTGDLPTAVT